MSQESSSHSSESSLSGTAPPVIVDPNRQLIVHAIQTHAAKDLHEMTQDQVVDTMIALALAPQETAPPPVALVETEPEVDHSIAASLSPDPLIANNQLRGLINQEIARLQQLAATPGILTSAHLFGGPLFA